MVYYPLRTMERDCTALSSIDAMDGTSYMEASVDIENILKFLCMDYVWRLSFLNHAGIQKSGIRITIRSLS